MNASRSKFLDGFCPGVIAVDFDGTIVDPSENYPEIGPVKEGAVEWLSKLKEMGFTLYIFTARPDLSAVETWLETQPVLSLIISSVTNRKLPQTTLFVDDRGFRFEGEWNQGTFDAIVGIMKYHNQCEQDRLAAVPK